MIETVSLRTQKRRPAKINSRLEYTGIRNITEIFRGRATTSHARQPYLLACHDWTDEVVPMLIF